MSGLTQRIITGVIFGVVMIGGVLYSEFTFVILFGIIGSFCLWEFLEMSLKNNEANFLTLRKVIGVVLGLIVYFLIIPKFHLGYWFLGDPPISHFSDRFANFIPIIFSLFIFELYTNSKKPFDNIGALVLGIIYTILPCILAYYIAYQYNIGLTLPKRQIILGLLFLTWANDVGAYFVGSKFGKTKLFPRISPKKTWEGSVGGAVTTFLIAWLLSLYVTELNLVDWLILAGIVSVFGSIGDLVESMLKRSVGVKDSGNLLPGHGGFLDRFDAFIFLLPFAASYLLWMR